MSTTVVVCYFSLILNCRLANQSNSITKSEETKEQQKASSYNADVLQSTSLFFATLSLSKNTLNPFIMIHRMVNKHYHQLPGTSITTLALQNNLKGTSFCISIGSLGIYVSPEYLLNFLSDMCISP